MSDYRNEWFDVAVSYFRCTCHRPFRFRGASALNVYCDIPCVPDTLVVDIEDDRPDAAHWFIMDFVESRFFKSQKGDRDGFDGMWGANCVNENTCVLTVCMDKGFTLVVRAVEKLDKNCVHIGKEQIYSLEEYVEDAVYTLSKQSSPLDWFTVVHVLEEKQAQLNHVAIAKLLSTRRVNVWWEKRIQKRVDELLRATDVVKELAFVQGELRSWEKFCAAVLSYMEQFFKKVHAVLVLYDVTFSFTVGHSFTDANTQGIRRLYDFCAAGNI